MGARLAVFGGVGAGKSAALRVLSGRTAPAQGSVRLLGRTPRAAAGAVGYAAQTPRLAGLATVYQTLAFHAARAGSGSAQRAAALAGALAACDLQGLRDRLVRELSHRERTLLGIASAIARRPSILFLDDITASLPPATAAALWGHLDDRRLEDGLTVVHATTSSQEAERADVVVLLRAGRVVACESPGALLARAAADTLTVEAADPRAVRRTLRGIFDVEIAECGDSLRFRAADGELAAAGLLRHPTGGVRTIYLRRPTLWDVLDALPE